jgi:predicted nuclease of predicted toxin-antitoxin system
MWKADDAEILKWSSERNAIIVTLDADFHTILAVSEASGPSVIRLRLQGLGASEVVDMIRKVLQSFESRSEARMSGTVKTRKTTCHWLPIGSSD